MQVLVARIGKPHGIRGEVTVELFTDAPEERFSRGEVLHIDGFTHGTVAATVAPAGALTVASARWNKKILVVRFEEITTRNHAEDLRNTLLMFEVPEDVNSEEEGFYEHQLLELPVFLLEDVPDGEIPNDNPAVGEPLGTVIGLQTMPLQDLLLVKLSPAYGGQEIMVPFVDEIVPEVVPAEGDEPGFVLLSPPEGLIELSTPLKGK